MDHKPNCETGNHQNPRGENRQQPRWPQMLNRSPKPREFFNRKFMVKLVSIQHPVLIPTGALLNTHHPPSHPSQPPPTLSLFAAFKSLWCFDSLPLAFFFLSPPPWSSLKFLRIHIRVKTYGPSLSLYDLFHLALTLSSCIHVATKGHISFFLIAT